MLYDEHLSKEPDHAKERVIKVGHELSGFKGINGALEAKLLEVIEDNQVIFDTISLFTDNRIKITSIVFVALVNVESSVKSISKVSDIDIETSLNAFRSSQSTSKNGLSTSNVMFDNVQQYLLYFFESNNQTLAFLKLDLEYYKDSNLLRIYRYELVSYKYHI